MAQAHVIASSLSIFKETNPSGHVCGGYACNASSPHSRIALGFTRPESLRPWGEGLLKSFSLAKNSNTRVNAGSKPRKGGIRALQLDVKEADQAKLDAFTYRRTVFTHDDWKKHRSSGRYLRHITTMLQSRVIGSLGPPVFTITAIAAAIVAWNQFVLLHILPETLPILHSNPLPFSLTAPALSFLLVFRTNSSYGRFDEARKMWGLMLNRTRDICRQALSYIARDDNAADLPKLQQFLRHLQAFPLTYKHHFLLEGSLEQDLRDFTSLTEIEIQGILESTHRPNYTLQMMSECMRSCSMDPIQRYSMDTNLTTFADDIGGSERIFKTPIPLSYTRLTSRFMVLWHAFLPLALWDACGWATILVTFCIAAAFFCIEEVGVLIEEPFSILALDVIAQSARNNVAELIKLHEGIKNRVVPGLQSSQNGSATKTPVSTLPSGVLNNSSTIMRE